MKKPTQPPVPDAAVLSRSDHDETASVDGPGEPDTLHEILGPEIPGVPTSTRTPLRPRRRAGRSRR